MPSQPAIALSNNNSQGANPKLKTVLGLILVSGLAANVANFQSYVLISFYSGSSKQRRRSSDKCLKQ
jgi:hypothetical protein